MFEGVEFKRSEAREEEEQHAGVYSFIAHETGGLAVFIIGQNNNNLTQVKTSLMNSYYLSECCEIICSCSWMLRSHLMALVTTTTLS